MAWEDPAVTHEHHTFHNPPPGEPAEVTAALDRGDLTAALNAMVGCVLHGHGDWQSRQALYLNLLDHSDRQVRRLAVICLGHQARVYRAMDEDRVVPILRALRRDPEIGGTAEDALSDIAIFLHPRRHRWRGRLYRLVRPWTWF